MKRNFYLQHPLMAMHDPRMQYLLKEIGYVARLMCRYGVFASLLQDA